MDKAIEAAFEAWWEQTLIVPSGHFYATDNKVAAKQAWEAAYQAASGEARDAARYLQALTAIRRIPVMPFPDPNGHSWEAFGRRVHAAWCEIQQVASQAITAAIAAREGVNDE